MKIPRGMLEYVVGMAGKVIESIAEDTKTRLMIKKPEMGAKYVFVKLVLRFKGALLQSAYWALKKTPFKYERH